MPWPRAARPVLVDHDHLAGFDLSYESRADDRERGTLRGDHPTGALSAFELEAPEAQRPEAVRVADRHEVRGVHEPERECALEHRQHRVQRRLEMVVRVRFFCRIDRRTGFAVRRLLACQQLRHEVAVGGRDTWQHAGLGEQSFGIGQVAVVAEREAGGTDRAVDGLGVVPGARSGRRVADMAESEVALQRGQGPLVEDGGDEAHVLHDCD